MSRMKTIHFSQAALAALRDGESASARVNQIIERYLVIVESAEPFLQQFTPWIDDLRAELDRLRAADGRIHEDLGYVRQYLAGCLELSPHGMQCAAEIADIPLVRFVALLEWLEQRPEFAETAPGAHIA